MAPEPDVRPASTVLVLRDSVEGPEVFMVRRHHKSVFMGGAHVFPGGGIEPGDYEADETWCDGLAEGNGQLADLPSELAAAHLVAGVRELFEEAGVLLARDQAGEFVSLADLAARARFERHRRDLHRRTRTLRDLAAEEGLKLALDALVPCAHWVTPPSGDVRRFDTRFFAAQAPRLQAPVHDDGETVHGEWITARRALAAAAARDIVLPPPTWAMLRELEPFAAVADLVEWARARAVCRREPRTLTQGDTRVLVMPGDPLHPEPEPVAFETRFIWIDDRWLPTGSSNIDLGAVT